MRSIEVSREVWDEIAKRGRFGETEDDVLRRVFNISTEKPPPRAAIESTARSRNGSRRRKVASQRMSSYVEDDKLIIDFHGGPRKTFSLPGRSDRDNLRRVRDQAVEFARSAGASYGQVMAVKKALTEAGFYLVK